MRTKITITFNNGDIKNYDDNSILSLVCSENITDTNLTITPGICEQYAEIKIYDRDNYLHERAYGNKTDDAKLECYCIDESNTEHLLGTYYASEWEVSGDDAVVRIKGRDKTYILDTVNIDALRRDGNKTLHQLITILFQNMHDYAWQYLDNETQTRCSSIVIPDCWYGSSTLREALDKICYLGMLRIFFSNDVFYVGRSL